MATSKSWWRGHGRVAMSMKKQWLGWYFDMDAVKNDCSVVGEGPESELWTINFISYTFVPLICVLIPREPVQESPPRSEHRP